MSFVEESGHETNEIDTTVGDLRNSLSDPVRKSSAHIGQKAYRDTITGNLQPVPARHSST